MMFSQENDPAAIKTSLENEVKGDPILIQEKLKTVNDLLSTEENQTCIRKPLSFRGPLPALIHKYLIQKEILEDMLRAAKLNIQPKPC